MATTTTTTQITEELLKRETRSFDLETVFRLSLIGRSVLDMSGVRLCPYLVELDLSGNRIARISGVNELVKLRRLNLSSNRIPNISAEDVAGLESLETLVLLDNLIGTVGSLAGLRDLHALRTLELVAFDGSLANPVCAKPAYRDGILELLPQLVLLDSTRRPTRPQTGAGGKLYEDLFARMHAQFRLPPVKVRTQPPLELPPPTPWINPTSFSLPPLPTDDDTTSPLDSKRFAAVRAECRLLCEKASSLISDSEQLLSNQPP
eukprot:gnl/Spiro4/13756_TR7343_c0_g1_i1.p2 gnl/Spiro4/13756_TR7343_c0_g1~~gnl/Spiro4/13756_TR7343_c0_g1_i1.p2  ORF type:complete len:303 (-),score=75.02 gnl/Spiro4/13756_TR7343_c0_g1_i1:11-799(-)